MAPRAREIRPVRRAWRYQKHQGKGRRDSWVQGRDRRDDRGEAPVGGLAIVNAGPEVWPPETNVVLAGMTAVPTTLWASLGPALARVIV